MSIDLGSHSTKVAVVMPGVPMEIALDSFSKRLIPTLILLKNGNRLFGNAATAGAIKDPKSAFAQLPTIIGKTLDHPNVKLYQQRYPHHNITYNEETGQLTFTLNDQQYTVEALLAMFLQYVRKVAENHLKSTVQTAVIGVPSHFTQADRKAIMRSAKLADIDVLQLVNDNAAIALNFAINRGNMFNKKPSFLFCDVGASTTVATIVSLQLSKTLVGDRYEEHPHVIVRGTGIDTTLGTSVFIDRLTTHLLNRFKETQKRKTVDVTKNLRAMAKFKAEAERVFRILSANKEITSVIEEVLEDEDLRVKVTRYELEEICGDLTERFKLSIFQALEMASMTLHDLEDVVIFGGGTRVPMVQKAILECTQKDALGKSINSDEAAALGLVYQSAFRTPGFRVKSFFVKDITRYPIAVSFKRGPKEGEEEPITEDIYSTRVLFNYGNVYPQKRTITFNRLLPEMDFLVHYGEVHPILNKYLNGMVNLFNVSITDVLLEAKKWPEYTPKGVKVHFTMDASGILNLTAVNLIMKPLNETGVANSTDSSTFQKIADGISSLFKTTPKETAKSLDESAANETTEVPANESSTSPVANATSKTTETNTSAPANKGSFVCPLSFEVINLDSVVPTADDMIAAKLFLQELERQDEEKRLLELTRNLLETTIYQSREKCESKPFVKHSTETERAVLLEIVSAARVWYDENGHTAKKTELDEQLAKITSVSDPLDKRMRGYAALPALLEEFSNMLNATESVLTMMRQLQDSVPKLPPLPPMPEQPMTAEAAAAIEKEKKEREDMEKMMVIFSDAEYEQVATTIEANRKHWDHIMMFLNTTPPFEDLPFALSDIAERTTKMHEEAGYFMRKAENWKLALRRAEANAKRKKEAADQKEKELKESKIETGAEPDSKDASSEATPTPTVAPSETAEKEQLLSDKTTSETTEKPAIQHPEL